MYLVFLKTNFQFQTAHEKSKIVSSMKLSLALK